ncbi:14103_t:CDS:2 [Cetraspora pellucida]|uniref:14103_t:CDS:1 n=1 Tax=Cetraspora pellucida TaxID=1433469 RepID=A0ACA9M3R8_9GLOM|nr:14103_t:CDS:2 [Cetraspora pellucida]
MEISSKKPVGRFRQIVEIPSNIRKRRDPRFDDLSGKFNDDLFEKSYSFLNEYKKSEMEEIKKRISKEKDPEEKQKLQQLLNKLQSRAAHESNLNRKKQLKREQKKKERELIAQGKSPFYLKKSEEKKLELVDKFKKLQKSDSKVLDKVIEKRRKKNASKEHRYIPFKRREALYTPLLLYMVYNATNFAASYPNHVSLATIVHVSSWIIQFIGHGFFEKRSPALKDNLVQALLLAPLFVWLEVLFHLRYRSSLRQRVMNKVGVAITKYKKGQRQTAE